MSLKTETHICNGRAALGPCSHRALYLLTSVPVGRSSAHRYACGLHMAQVVKHLIPQWGGVCVSDIR